KAVDVEIVPVPHHEAEGRAPHAEAVGNALQGRIEQQGIVGMAARLSHLSCQLRLWIGAARRLCAPALRNALCGDAHANERSRPTRPGSEAPVRVTPAAYFAKRRLRAA